MQHMLPSLHNCIDFRYKIPEVFCWAFGRRAWDHSLPVVTGRRHFGAMPIWLTAASTAFGIGIGTVRVYSTGRGSLLVLEASLVGGPKVSVRGPYSVDPAMSFYGINLFHRSIGVNQAADLTLSFTP